MINKTSDLVKRATQLADLEGSDFISWNENMNLINEAYTELYQKMIDAGEKSFLKSFHMSSGAVKLPFDFWQLKGVYVYNGGHLSVINRRAGNQDLNSVSYELKNNQLIIYGYASDVLVEYFPKPKFLTYKPEKKRVAALDEIVTKIHDCYKHTFLIESVDEESNETLSILDLDGIKTVDNIFEVAHDDISKAFICEDYVVVILDDTSVIVYNITTATKVTLEEPAAPVFTPDGNLFFVADGKVQILEINAENDYSFTEIQECSYIGNFFVCDDGFSDFFYLNDGIIEHNGEPVETNFTADKLEYKNGECYFLRNMAFGKITNDNTVAIIDPAPGLFVGFIGLDDNTGFGYITKKFGKYFVCPFVEDTVLNFPNSFFYKYISFALAIAYKIKQGADASGLQYQLNQAEQTFLDSLGEDANQFPRIGNVY